MILPNSVTNVHRFKWSTPNSWWINAQTEYIYTYKTDEFTKFLRLKIDDYTKSWRHENAWEYEILRYPKSMESLITYKKLMSIQVCYVQIYMKMQICYVLMISRYWQLLQSGNQLVAITKIFCNETRCHGWGKQSWFQLPGEFTLLILLLFLF